ncbi:thioredoxin reductase (NADPH) [Silvibacterium bohemicum]|uniref:Thioredoxin reductase (NADPH) n=2 Tax=Silvibacterium bohemicum TaxID=1577686 RepID=A0A841K1B5_9BACT|nr:thioredoxin reductase (NADPH) [Silvibacterium bohemicum]
MGRTAADLHVRAGDWLTREGDMPCFFVVIEGGVEFLKEIGGVARPLGVYESEECFGEVPLLLGARVLVGLRARVDSRILRMDGPLFYELISESKRWSERILEIMATRVGGVQEMVCKTKTTRVVVVGDENHSRCRDILSFLSRSRIPYSWVDRIFDRDRLPSDLSIPLAGLTAIIDGQTVLHEPTERELAEALGIQTKPRLPAYDVVIVGGGPAGLAAAVCGASEGLKVLMIEQATPGGQAGTSSRIENYLGFPGGISGEELSQRALQQASRFGSEIVVSRKVEQIVFSGEKKTLTLNGGTRIDARSIILAIGVEWRLLDAAGIDRLSGRGVLYGASRTEAMAVVGKHIFIVGGGNSAGQAALFFSGYAARVTVLVRGESLSLSMSQYLITEIGNKANIAVEAHTEVVSVDGANNLETIQTRNRQTGVISPRAAGALFIMIGATANTSWLPHEIHHDEHGYLCTGRDIDDMWRLSRLAYPLETSVPGVFCVGDIRHGSIKRVASGVGEGSMVISFVHQYLSLSNHTPALESACDMQTGN